ADRSALTPSLRNLVTTLDHASARGRQRHLGARHGNVPWRHPMKIITYYVALVLAADVVAVLLCLAIEKVWPAGSLPIFLGLYFSILWGAWAAAVRLTEPKISSVTQPAE